MLCHVASSKFYKSWQAPLPRELHQCPSPQLKQVLPLPTSLKRLSAPPMPSRALPEYCHHCCWFSLLSSSDRAGRWVGSRSSQGSAPRQPEVWLGKEGKGGKISSETYLVSHAPSLIGLLRLVLMFKCCRAHSGTNLTSRISEVKLPCCRTRGPVTLVPLRRQRCVISPEFALEFYLLL